VAKVVWSNYVRDLVEELPPREAELIAEKVKPLSHFPRMYPIRQKGRFRRHRWLLAGRWIVFYRVVDEIVYVRGIWPAQIP
jgi:plasmid stabilization system protein ParE